MKHLRIHVSEDAYGDILEGRQFYNQLQDGVGHYFFDSMVAEIESLVLYAGIHPRHSGFYRMLARRFPYALYYEMSDDSVWVIAVLPLRRDPAWIHERLNKKIE